MLSRLRDRTHARRSGHQDRADRSGSYIRQPDEVIIADRGDAFQRDVSCALYGPLVVLLEQDGANEADDGDPRWDADGVGAPLGLPMRRSSGLVECSLARCCVGKLM